MICERFPMDIKFVELDEQSLSYFAIDNQSVVPW